MVVLVQPIKNNKIMIIDLNKIKSLEKKFQNDRIALAALQNMVHLVTQADESILKSSIALSTLKELGVVTTEDSQQPQQLNS